MPEIYAEITKKMFNRVEEYGFPFRIPSGVELRRKRNSRACYFTCANDEVTSDLVNLLDRYGINWQNNS